MKAALLAEDPGAEVLPYCLSGGTDNKALSTLGITGYGFAPLQLPADLDFAPMFHGIDERVPVVGPRVRDQGAPALHRHLLREVCRVAGHAAYQVLPSRGRSPAGRPVVDQSVAAHT